MQSRPSGITHSSAMLAPLSLAGAAVYIGQFNDRRLRLTDFILVSVVVFAGSKLLLLCFMLIIFLSFLRKNRIIRTRLIYILCLLIIMLWIYYLTFPASIEHNYNMGAFTVPAASEAISHGGFVWVSHACLITICDKHLVGFMFDTFCQAFEPQKAMYSQLSANVFINGYQTTHKRGTRMRIF